MKNLFFSLCFLSLASLALGQTDSSSHFSVSDRSEQESYSLENSYSGRYRLGDSVNDIFHTQLMALKDKILEMQKQGIAIPLLLSASRTSANEYILTYQEMFSARFEYFSRVDFSLLPGRDAEFSFFLDTITWSLLVEEFVFSGNNCMAIKAVYEIQDYLISGNCYLPDHWTTASGLRYYFTKKKLECFILVINEDLDRRKALAEKPKTKRKK